MRVSDSPARAFVCSTVSFWNAKRVGWSLRGLASMSRSRACADRPSSQRAIQAAGAACRRGAGAGARLVDQLHAGVQLGIVHQGGQRGTLRERSARGGERHEASRAEGQHLAAQADAATRRSRQYGAPRT